MRGELTLDFPTGVGVGRGWRRPPDGWEDVSARNALGTQGLTIANNSLLAYMEFSSLRAAVDEIPTKP